MMVGVNIDDDQLALIADRTIQEADDDKDGFISYEEFSKVRVFIVISHLEETFIWKTGSPILLFHVYRFIVVPIVLLGKPGLSFFSFLLSSEVLSCFPRSYVIVLATIL